MSNQPLGRLRIVSGPRPVIRLEIEGKVVWLGRISDWSEILAHPVLDADLPSAERLAWHMGLQHEPPSA